MLVQLAKASLIAFRSQCHFNSILVLKFLSLIQRKENVVKTRYKAALGIFYWALYHNRVRAVSLKQICQGKL